MYDSEYANGLKTFTSDFFNISDLQRWKLIYENYSYRVLKYSVIRMVI
jgi:hypothetical protein